MDFCSVVYKVVGVGKLQLLQKLLSGWSWEELEELMGEVVGEGMLLFIVVCYGYLDVVEYLVDWCGVSVEVGGLVYFDGEIIEGVLLFWVVLVVGYLVVVCSLLCWGVLVNCMMCINLMFLCVVCFDGYLEVVRYLVGEYQVDLEVVNWYGYMCFMILCYKGYREIARYLLEQGAQVNRRSVKGNTVLYDCVEFGSLEILQLLFGCYARMERDGYGMISLLAVSVTGYINIVEYFIQEQSVIQEALLGRERGGFGGAAQFQSGFRFRSEEFFSGEFYESCCFISREAAVEVLELLGVIYVDKKRDLLGVMKYWRRVMELRYQGGIYLFKSEFSQRVLVYDYCKEVNIVKELEAFIIDFDEMRMQVFLIRERILGFSYSDTFYYIRYRGVVYVDSGNFERCIYLWKYVLDM